VKGFFQHPKTRRRIIHKSDEAGFETADGQNPARLGHKMNAPQIRGRNFVDSVEFRQARKVSRARTGQGADETVVGTAGMIEIDKDSPNTVREIPLDPFAAQEAETAPTVECSGLDRYCADIERYVSFSLHAQSPVVSEGNTRKSSITSASRPHREKHFRASSGEQTIGSPARLNDVFKIMGMPVIS
jgi:hypothetical protein